MLARHPWSLTGGGAVELTQRINAAGLTILRSRVQRVGFFADSHADEAFFVPANFARLLDIPSVHCRPSVRGDDLRDWGASSGDSALFPYDSARSLVDLGELGSACCKMLWPVRALLAARSTFGGGTYLSDGRRWWEWHQLPKDVGSSNLTLGFAFVVTHNHFVLDRGEKVFNRSAPVIKLPEGANEEAHLELLGVLNSSTACFWLKQESHPKSGSGIGRGVQDESWENRYEFTGTTLQDFPLPAGLPLERGRMLDELAQELARQTPAAVCGEGTPTMELLNAARDEHDRIRAWMIAEQEELDWEVYRLYGLVSENLTYQGDDLPGLALGERAFEIALARSEEETAWFDRHGSTPITELPGHWPAGYRDLVQQRLDLIAADPSIRLLEKPEYKRRWSLQAWGKREQAALRDWLLDRLEDHGYWFDPQGRPQPRSIAQLADAAARDRELVGVLALWEGRPDVPVTESLQRLLADEAVPYLAAYRYKDSGLRKRAAWERTWELQRREDAGEQVAPIPVPPKYTSADFARKSYWDARGKLDVPKERFIAYPHAGRDTDLTPLLGWAGWDHAEQALALGRIVTEREAEGWADERIIPLVAGLAELQPWVTQWHAELHPVYGISLGAYCEEE
ncbi:MAG: BREX-2 system adenine-specific DNA-methyltransferase PglX, partial [Actinobacteria bacterium]|nr:BREX-2 system adenine-specific DNA-methyltransferase PglX [Actinomycetota bacterium]